MGDRTSVELVTLAADDDIMVQTIGDELEGDEKESYRLDGVDLICRSYYEVNYAELGFEEQLQNLNIPYSKHWATGGEYSAGESHLRIDNDGKQVLKEFYEGEVGVMPIEEVERGVHEGMDSMLALLHQYKEKHLVLGWETQTNRSDITK